MEEKDKYLLSSLDNALTILDALGKAGPMTLTEIRRELGFSNASIVRMLHTMELHHCVYKSRSGKYALGYKLVSWGSYVNEHDVLISVARPYLTELRELFNETAHLNLLLPNGNVLFACREASTYAISMHTQVGSELPAYCTATGKALLSCLDTAKVERYAASYRYEKFTANTIVTAEDLLGELHHVRQVGFAEDREESEPGLTCMAVPVRDAAGGAAAAVSISGPTMRMMPIHSQMKDALFDAASKIAAKAGLL